MKRFLKFLFKRHWKSIFLVIVLLAIQTYFQLDIITMFGQALTLVESKDIGGVYTKGMLMLLLIILIMFVMGLVSYISITVSANLSYEIRERIFSNLTYLSQEQLNTFKISGLMSRTTRGVYSQQGFVYICLKYVLIIPIVAIGTIIKLYFIQPLYALIFLIIIIISAIILFLRLKHVTNDYFKAKKTYGRINKLFREKVIISSIIRIFNKEEFENEKFGEAVANSYQKSIKYQLVQYPIAPVVLLLFDLATVLLFAESGFGFVSINMEVTTTVLIFNYLIYFVGTLNALPLFIQRYPQAYATSIRLEEVLDIEREESYNGDAKKIDDFEGIEFKNVTFKNIINDVSFKISKNTKVALVGPTSSGKTTLMNLLDGINTLDSGKITIDGIDISTLDLNKLHSMIGYSTQKIFLLNDTVYENIKMGNESITRSKAMELCEDTLFKTAFRYLKNGLEEVIEERGLNIGYSDKQKLSITRTIAHNKDINIFDDSFSQIGSDDVKVIKNNIEKYLENKITIMIDNDLEDMEYYDNIIVLNEGLVVDSGSHEYLLNNCDEYKKLIEGGVC